MSNQGNKTVVKVGNSIHFQYKLNFILKLTKRLSNQQKKIFLIFVKH